MKTFLCYNFRVFYYPKRRRQWQPTPVLLPGKSHGWRSLVGCSPWGRYRRTWLSDFTFTFHFHALEEEMAAHSSVLAWRLPVTGSLVGCRSSSIPKTCFLATAVTSYFQLESQKIANILTISKDLFFFLDISHKYAHACLLSAIGLFETLWPLACQAPLSMWFSQQEYWNGLPFTLSRDLLDPGTEPVSPVLQADSLLLSHEENPFT